MPKANIDTGVVNTEPNTMGCHVCSGQTAERVTLHLFHEGSYKRRKFAAIEHV